MYSSDQTQPYEGNTGCCWLMILKIKVMLFIFIVFSHSLPSSLFPWLLWIFFFIGVAVFAIVCSLSEHINLFFTPDKKKSKRAYESSMHIYDSIHLRWVTRTLPSAVYKSRLTTAVRAHTRFYFSKWQWDVKAREMAMSVQIEWMANIDVH